MRAGEGAELADLMRHEQGELAAYDGSGVYFGFWLLISTARPITPPPQRARFCSPLRAHVTCTNWRSREHKTQQKEANFFYSRQLNKNGFCDHSLTKNFFVTVRGISGGPH